MNFIKMIDIKKIISTHLLHYFQNLILKMFE
jgi:hypothetical protein